MKTTLDAEQKKKLVEWMVDRSVDTDIDSQEHTYPASTAVTRRSISPRCKSSAPWRVRA